MGSPGFPTQLENLEEKNIYISDSLYQELREEIPDEVDMAGHMICSLNPPLSEETCRKLGRILRYHSDFGSFEALFCMQNAAASIYKQNAIYFKGTNSHYKGFCS